MFASFKTLLEASSQIKARWSDLANFTAKFGYGTLEGKSREKYTRVSGKLLENLERPLELRTSQARAESVQCLGKFTHRSGKVYQTKSIRTICSNIFGFDEKNLKTVPQLDTFWLKQILSRRERRVNSALH